jgi:hypothetical protein
MQVFPTLFNAMHRVNEVAVEKVRQHGAPTLSPHYHFFVTNSQGFLSFFLSFLLSFFFFPFFSF